MTRASLPRESKQFLPGQSPKPLGLGGLLSARPEFQPDSCRPIFPRRPLMKPCSRGYW